MSTPPDHTNPDAVSLTPLEAQEMDRLVREASERLEEALPSHLTVLFGLQESGRGDVLSDAERALCQDRHAHMKTARREHPALDASVGRVADDAALFEEVWASRMTGARPPAPRKRIRTSRWPARIGLGISAAVLAGVFYLSVATEVARTTTTAPESAFLTVALHDGSSVRLSPGASVTYVPGSRFDRTVTLDGQAYFDVAPETRRFAVETTTAVTTVLGTRFGVTATDQDTEIVLVSGSVAVAPRANRTAVVVLEPGESTRVSAGAPPMPPEDVIVSEALSWSDLIILRETSMERVQELLAASRDTNVALGPGLAALTVTGTFQPEQSAQEILAILAATLNARLEVVDDGFRLTLK